MLEQGQFAEAARLCQEVIERAERSGVPAAALPSVLGWPSCAGRSGALDEAADLLGAARLLEAGRPRTAVAVRWTGSWGWWPCAR